jgi:hypothetical protein
MFADTGGILKNSADLASKISKKEIIDTVKCFQIPADSDETSNYDILL